MKQEITLLVIFYELKLNTNIMFTYLSDKLRKDQGITMCRSQDGEGKFYLFDRYTQNTQGRQC